jgi:hypothetical protein
VLGLKDCPAYNALSKHHVGNRGVARFLNPASQDSYRYERDLVQEWKWLPAIF